VLDGPAHHREVAEPGNGWSNRGHHVEAGAGRLVIDYSATVRFPPATSVEPSPAERLVALRQSRYCPSDLIEGFAAHELGHLRGQPDAGQQIGAWVHGRLGYELGSSAPGDTAVDTLLLGSGVCRDYAHLTVMLCRALGVPARFVAVYAPGLYPMDFHAVAEVAGADGWEIVDATRLAPRGSLVRIATGRDAADTALVTTVDGHAELLESNVLATVNGELPGDDHLDAVPLA
jgi:transglutaminase-like putative cysteine protease